MVYPELLAVGRGEANGYFQFSYFQFSYSHLPRYHTAEKIE